MSIGVIAEIVNSMESFVVPYINVVIYLKKYNNYLVTFSNNI